LINVLDRAFDNPLIPEEHAAAPFAGGIKQHGYQCGMIWGSVLAAGAQAFKLFGPGPEAETRAVEAAVKLVDTFHSDNGEINCYEITEIDKSSSALKMITFFLLKGGTIGCFRMAGRFAPLALKEINKAISEDSIRIPASPVSCASLLAEKMGATERQKVMVSGFAGGIGLCGGGCGALGAAIWLMGMKLQQEADIKNLWNDESFNSNFNDLVERFLASSDYEFECADIVGRKFDNFEDHASFISEGGCCKIIEALAAV
jgi:hypothetical protein